MLNMSNNKEWEEFDKIIKLKEGTFDFGCIAELKQFINDKFTPNSQIRKAMKEVFDEKMEKLDYIPRNQANNYRIGYQKGFDDAMKDCISKSELLERLNKIKSDVNTKQIGSHDYQVAKLEVVKELLIIYS